MRRIELSRINLYTIFKDIMRNIWIIVLAAVVGFVTGVTSFAYLVPEKYVSSMTVSVNLSGYTTSSTAVSLTRTVTIAETLDNVFQSDALRDVIAKDIGEENMGTIWAAQQSETNLITIYSMASSPVTAYNTLDSLARNYHKVTKNVFSNVIISVVVNPQMPRSSSNTAEPFPMGVVFGIFFAALVTGIVSLISYMRETVKDAYDIEHELGVSLFGTIYRFKPLGEDLPEDKRREIISNHLMGFEFAECFRRMAIKIESLHRTKKAKVFMITSVAENEGKTMAATNLAIAIAMNGHRTLLIDCDFKNPSIHKSFKYLDRPEGTDFHQYISNGGDISQFIRHDPETGIFIADCKKYCHDSPELLGSARFVETLAAFREEFDFVIIDTPPCALTIDPEIIATHSDSVLMIVRQDYVCISDIYEHIENLSNIHFAGCIFNHVGRFKGASLKSSNEHDEFYYRASV